MSLLELTVVILVLLGLISVMFIGAKAWRRGADRGMCVMNIQVVQKAVRSYGNLYGFNPGDQVSALKGRIFAPGSFLEAPPSCQGGGEYSYGVSFGENTIPPIGQIYMECSFGGSRDHALPVNGEW